MHRSVVHIATVAGGVRASARARRYHLRKIAYHIPEAVTSLSVTQILACTTSVNPDDVEVLSVQASTTYRASNILTETLDIAGLGVRRMSVLNLGAVQWRADNVREWPRQRW